MSSVFFVSVLLSTFARKQIPMAELNIHVTTDGESLVDSLRKGLDNTTKAAEGLSDTMKAINKAAGGQELYFATTKAREGFIALVNEAQKLEKRLADPSMKGADNFKELSGRLADVRSKVVDMASSAAMAGKVMSTSFVYEMNNAASSVKTLEERMVVAKNRIDKIQSQLSERGSSLKASGGDVSSDSVYQGLEADLKRQKDVLKSTNDQLENSRKHLGNLREAQSVFGNVTVKTTDSMDMFLDKLNQIPVVGRATTGVFSQIKYAMSDVSFALLGGLGFEQLGVRIFNTRSMMQKLEISFETMLQSASKASDLMGQLTQTAAKTPFGMMDVTNGAKQLLAYGTAAEDVNGILIKLGDISAGLGLPLGDLVYLYGTTMAQGRMFTQDLRQFMGRGIPMAEELGKILVSQGKATKGTMAEVQDAVTKGKVSADMVKMAIEGMTAEGSRFGGLMERQSSTLQGQWANIEDTVDMMFNDMGKSTEGFFNTSLNWITKILDNWQSIVKIIGVAIAGVGAYKTGLMAAASVQNFKDKEQKNAVFDDLDNNIKSLKEREKYANEFVGYDIADTKTKTYQQNLGKVVANSQISDEIVERTLQEAQARGLIDDTMANELREKRELLMAQEKLTAQAEEEAHVVAQKNQHVDEMPGLVKERDAAKKELADLDKQMAEIDAQIAEQERKVAEAEKNYNPHTDYEIAKSSAESATSSRKTAETDFNRVTAEYDAQSQKVDALYKGGAEGTPEFDAELAKLDTLKAKREEAKNAYLVATEEEKKAIEKVKAAQDALNGSTQRQKEIKSTISPQSTISVEEAQMKIDAIDDQIAAQEKKVEDMLKGQVKYNGKGQAMRDESGNILRDESTKANFENEDEYLAEVEKLNELKATREQVMEEFMDACINEQEGLNGVIQKQDELNQKTKGGTTEGGETSGTSAPIVGGATEQATTAQKNLTEAIKEGTVATEESKTAADASTTAVEALGNAKEAAADAEENNTSAKESGVAATEAGTTATQTSTSAETVNAEKKRLAEMRANQKAVAEAKEAAATTVATTQTKIDTLAQNEEAAAKSRNSLVTGIVAAKTNIATVATKLWTAATRECTTAWNGFTAALATNPITAIFTAITTVGSALYMFWEPLKEWLGFGDDAEEAAETYENAADTAMAKTNELYAQMDATASGTKAHRDAIKELADTCEQYGISLNKTVMDGKDEEAQAAELTRVHKELAQAISEEAIQQDYLNNIKKAREDEDLDEDKKDFKNSLDDDYFSESDGSKMLALINDDDIEKLGRYKQELSTLEEGSKDYMFVQEEYNQIRDELVKTNMDYVESIVRSNNADKDEAEVIKLVEKAQSNAADGLLDYINAATDKRKVTLDSIDEEEKSRDAAEAAAQGIGKMTAAQVGAAEKAKILKMKVADVSTEIERLLKSHGNNEINFKFTAWMENLNVPQWMLNKTTKELQKDLAGWSALLAEYDKKSKGNRNYKMKVKGYGEVDREFLEKKVGENSSALTQRQAADDKKEADEAAAKKETEKKKKKAEQAAKKAADEAKRNAADAAKRETATDKANKAYADTVANWVEKANETIQKDTLDAMEEGTQKQIDKIKLDTKKQLDAIDDQKKKLVDARKKQALAVWINAAKDRKEAGWKDTADGKKTDEDWWKEISTATAKDTDGNEIKDAQGKAMSLADLLAKEQEDVNKKSAKQLDAVNKEILEDYREFLEKYGTLQQQRLALDMKYQADRKKIEESTDTDTQKHIRLKTLSKEYETDRSSLETKKMAEGIDWKALMTGVGSMSTEMIKTMIPKLEAHMDTETFKKADAQSQQKVVDILSEMRQYVKTDTSTAWKDLAKGMVDFTNAVKEYQAAQENEQAAYADLQGAETKATVAGKQLKEGKITQEQYDAIIAERDNLKLAAENASEVVSQAQQSMSNFGTALNNLTDKVKNQTGGLTAALNNAGMWKNVDGFSNVLGASQNFDQMKGNFDAWRSDAVAQRTTTAEAAAAAKVIWEQAQRDFESGKITEKEYGEKQSAYLSAQGEANQADNNANLAEGIGGDISKLMGNISNTMGSVMEGVFSSGITQIIGGIAQIPQMIMQFAGAISGAISGILDTLTEFLKFEWLEDAINGIMESASNLIDAIFDLPENLFHVLSSVIVNGIGGLLNTIIGRVGNVITGGLLSSGGPAEWFTNGNEEEVAEKLEELNDRNEILTRSIDALTEELKKQSGVEAVGTAMEAIDYTLEQIANTRKIYETQMGYHSSHNSWGYYYGKNGLTNEQISRMNAKFNREDGSQWTGNLSDLTPHEMKLLLADAEIYERLKNTGKGNYSAAVLEDMQAYADLENAVSDVVDTLNEAMTQVSFDSLRDNFKSTLMDMDSDVYDFTDNFTEMLMNAVLDAKMSELMDDELESFYKKWSEYSSGYSVDEKGNKTETNDYGLDASEIAELKSEWENLANKGLTIREEVANITGYEGSDSDADSSTGAWSDLGEETGRALEGRFAALQIQTTKIADILSANIGESGLNAMSTTVTMGFATIGGMLQTFAQQVALQTTGVVAGNTIADEGRTILAQMQLSLASIDERQGNWDKSFKSMFTQITDIRNDIRNKL